MHTFLRTPRPLPLLACAAGILAAACGGGGSGSGEFAIVEISVPHNGTWQINRPMLFRFTDEVDFSSVNLNTINITQTGGAPAAGEFFEADPFTVGFQPRCPTTDDYLDSGLLPGGVQYTIRIPGTSSGGLTVRSESGARLTDSQTVNFSTPNSTDASVIFLDTQIGPPNPVIRTSAADPNLAATYLELGNDPANRVYFTPRDPIDVALGAKVVDGFTSGLNLYSDPSSHVSILVAINQPVTPSQANISIDTVRLEYLTAAQTWENVAHTVQLVANCTAAGAVLRVTPTGILPQNRTVRVLLTRDFRDLVGDSNLVDLTIGSFLVATATDPGTTTPGIAGDEAFEEFAVGGVAAGSKEDTTTILASPRADWGSNGTLRAGFAFGGTGGPGGDFDWKVGNDLPLSNNNHPQVLLDTSFTVITNQQQTAQQTVINGIVDVRDLFITASGQLLIGGPNRCTILVSGNAQIDGEITISGSDNLSVASLNTTAQAEPGASGRGGGGRGGAGSLLSTQSDAGGETGRGAFDAAGAGGVGGESGFRATYPLDSFDGNRRPAGGGGGSLGPDFLRPMNIQGGYSNPNQCPDQSIVGLDAEKGFDGAPLATGAITGITPPQGGAKGPRPFFDGDPTNDFWGTMRTQGGQLIRGELLDPWAGAGGGGGGDAILSNSFPTTPFNPFGDEKGAGGGGGGGSITILALGRIRFGPRGRILASGGTGGGGENSGGGNITHIGGGSGGGSGGHIILQSATQIDMSAMITSPTGVNMPAGGLYALGGQGGAGKDDAGGAHPNGVPAPPQLDALPSNSYPNSTAPCGVVQTPPGTAGYTFNNLVGNSNPSTVIVCAGGDGGPGIIQLHTPSLADILRPTTAGETVYKTIRPPPVGSTPATGAPDFNVINGPPTAWNQMLPIFGRNSQAISKWVPLGGAAVNADDAIDAPDPIHFDFDGTDVAATGSILTTGAGANATVAELPPVFTGTLAASPTLPFIAADFRTLVVTGSALSDDIYLRNPALLRRFLLRLTFGAATDKEIASATYDVATGQLRMTVSGSGMPLAGFLPGTAIQLRPRFFKVKTDGTDNSLPDSSDIIIEFQATTPTAQDDPNESPGALSAWVKDISQIDPNAGHPDYRFFRFRITFDISAQGAPLTFNTPIPSMDFIRIPFRF